MKLTEIAEVLQARCVTGENPPPIEVRTACGSDMMSDVLAAHHQKDVLLTGLVNPQVVKTADLLDVSCIVFVRNKKPDESLIALAQERGITVLCTSQKMFESCGMLYAAGLRGVEEDA
jgi:hypothetical protein